MGRHRPGKRVMGIGCVYVRGWGGGWRISWTYDRYYAGSRLRFPTTISRDTDEAGARRFCKKWDIVFPEREVKCGS